MKAGVALLLGIFFTINAFAQGTVNFANTVSTRLTTNSTPTPPPGQAPNQTGNTTGTGHYTIGLYIAPQGTTDPTAFTLMGPTTPNGPAGLFNGNPAVGFFVISNNTGQTIAFQVRAWSTFAGARFETAFGNPFAYRGVSTIGEVTPAIGLATPPVLFGTSAGQVGGFVLYPPVPEPSSTVLLLLGAAAGLALWRGPFRKR